MPSSATDYRQKGCATHAWKSLSPGESADYTWAEPLKATKLSVRVGMTDDVMNQLKKQNEAIEGSTKARRPLFEFQFTENEEQGHFGPTKTGTALRSMPYAHCPERSRNSPLGAAPDSQAS